MKYFKAILFTLLMVFIFFGVIVFVQGVDAAQKIAKVIVKSFEEGNYHVMLRGNYQSDTPIIDLELIENDLTIVLKGYETISIEDDEVVEYLEIIVIVTEGKLDSFTDIQFSISDEIEVQVWLLKYLNLEVYTLVASEDGQDLLKVEDLFENDTTVFETINISYNLVGDPETDGRVEYIFNINLTRNEFTFANTLQNYYDNNNNEYPEEDTTSIRVVQDVEINTLNSLLTSGGITLVLIVLFTYYIYSVRPKRKLGKKKPTVHLQRDLDKLREKHENEEDKQ